MSADESSGMRRVQVLYELRRFDEAIELLSREIAARPQDVRPRCQLSLCHLNAGRPAESLEAAEAALAVQPDDEWALRLRSLALSRLGRGKEALSSARAALHHAPHSVAAQVALCSALLGDGQVKEAHRLATTMVAEHPHDPNALEMLGLSLLRSRQLGHAEQVFRRQLSMGPDNPVALNNLGVVVLRRQRADEAVELFTRAAQLMPSNPQYRRNVGIAGRARRAHHVPLRVLMTLTLMLSTLVVVLGDSWAASALGVVLFALPAVPNPFARWRQDRASSSLEAGVRSAMRENPLWRQPGFRLFAGAFLAFAILTPLIGELALLFWVVAAIALTAHSRRRSS